MKIRTEDVGMEISCTLCKNSEAFKFSPYRKKPSERIKEISAQLNSSSGYGCWELRGGELAICQYLDEQYEKANK